MILAVATSVSKVTFARPFVTAMGNFLMENRNGLVVDACLTEANGHAERIAALHMIEPRADRPRPITLGADKATTPRISSTNC